MTYSARQQVLAEYRQMRGTRMAPFTVMDTIRCQRANMIAMYLAHGRQPSAPLIAEWVAATDYLNSMTARPAWWWHATRPQQSQRRRLFSRRRYHASPQGKSTIPT